jgi:hypothetical protein
MSHARPLFAVLAALLVAALLVAAPAASAAGRLDPTIPGGGFAVERALGCGSTDPRAPQYYFWTGTVHARRAGEPDRLLFNVQGVNPRACRFVEDAKLGPGYQAAARELMLYLDPATDAVLNQWRNPWTGELVDVVQMENDPASMRAPAFERDAEGRPTPPRMRWTDMGQAYGASRTQSFFRDSPLGGAYQQFVGGKYRVMEISTFTITKADLAAWRPGRPLPYTATWVRISDWLPWMKMAGRDGQVVLTSQGRSSLSFDQLPEPLRSEIVARHPMMKQTPAFDDPRPFQTSWDSLKKALDAQQAR